MKILILIIIYHYYYCLNLNVPVLSIRQSLNIAEVSGGILEVSISHDGLARRLVVSLIQVRQLPRIVTKVQNTKTAARPLTYRVKVTAFSSRQSGRLKQSRASKTSKQADPQGKAIRMTLNDLQRSHTHTNDSEQPRME